MCIVVCIICILIGTLLMCCLASRMVFDIDSLCYLHLWSAAINSLVYWELLQMHNGMNRRQKVTQSHWVEKCIRLLPRIGRWTKVSFGLSQLVTGLRGWRCCGFPRWGLDSTLESCSSTHLQCPSRTCRALKPTHFSCVAEYFWNSVDESFWPRKT